MFVRSRSQGPSELGAQSASSEVPMVSFVRSLAALVLLLPALASMPVRCGREAFQRDELADAAIKLEARIKSAADGVTKSAC